MKMDRLIKRLKKAGIKVECQGLWDAGTVNKPHIVGFIHQVGYYGNKGTTLVAKDRQDLLDKIRKQSPLWKRRKSWLRFWM